MTPKQDSFWMPAEFEPHAGCWMLWPERPDNWRNGAQPAQQVFAEVASTIARFEPVTVGVSAAQYQTARAMLPAQIRVVEMPSNDAWMRDVGATCVINQNGAVRGVDWIFNAWGGHHGGLYAEWDKDDAVAQKMCDMEGLPCYRAPFIMEGGAIHVDGQGTLITTEECLLNPNRNPHLSRVEIENLLQEYAGIEKIIWLGRGVYLDETDGHVDNLCCFVRPGVVALTWTEDTSDPQYEISCDAYERLRRATDARGRQLEVHKIHQPSPLYITQAESDGVVQVDGSHPRHAGQRMAGSYINFYIANGGVIVPIFSDPHDQPALAQLQALFPEREVVGVQAREILLGGGNIHCITQQLPVG